MKKPFLLPAGTTCYGPLMVPALALAEGLDTPGAKRAALQASAIELMTTRPEQGRCWELIAQLRDSINRGTDHTALAGELIEAISGQWDEPIPLLLLTAILFSSVPNKPNGDRPPETTDSIPF